MAWCIALRKKRCQKSGGGVPRSGVVVIHDADLIYHSGDVPEVCSRLHLRLIANRNRQHQAPADRIHLPPELLEQGTEGLSIALLRILPVHVDSVEYAWLGNSWSEVPAQENVDARSHKRCALIRPGALFEICRRTLERDEYLQFRIPLLQLLQLMEVATKG
jgi:hypothetical protein